MTSSILAITVCGTFLLLGTRAHGQQFTVQPESVVQAEGLEAVFECLYPGALAHNWGINGNFPAAEQFPADMTRIAATGNSPAKLIIPATAKYNNTNVLCSAIVDVGSAPELVSQRNATLIVQGQLDPVSGLIAATAGNSSLNITISWSPPFSLNLTTAEPDIQYCVDVYDSTDRLVESVCGVTEEHYSFSPSNPNPSCWYTLTVTPRSNVEGALNGTTSWHVLGLLSGVSAIRGFSIWPQQVLVVQMKGLEASFECLFPGATSYSWLVNRSHLSLPPPSGIYILNPSSSYPAARLIIPVALQFNNTVVQCEAIIGRSGHVTSCPVLMVVSINTEDVTTQDPPVETDIEDPTTKDAIISVVVIGSLCGAIILAIALIYCNYRRKKRLSIKEVNLQLQSKEGLTKAKWKHVKKSSSNEPTMKRGISWDELRSDISEACSTEPIDFEKIKVLFDSYKSQKSDWEQFITFDNRT